MERDVLDGDMVRGLGEGKLVGSVFRKKKFTIDNENGYC